MTFSSNYQSRKELLVSILNNKDISSNSDEGLSTLIGKIDNIPSYSNSGVILYCDNSSILDIENWYEGDIGFYALVIEDGVYLPNEFVNFCGICSETSTQKTTVANTSLHVGCKYDILNIPTLSSGQKIYFDADHKIVLSYSGGTYNNTLTIFNETTGSSGHSGVTNIIYRYGKLIVVYALGNIVVKDVSYCDMSVIESNVSGLVVNDYGLSATTNSRGIANINYHYEDIGNRYVVAKHGHDTSNSIDLVDNRERYELKLYSYKYSLSVREANKFIAVVTVNDAPFSDVEIEFDGIGDNVTATTDSNGMAIVSYTPTSTGTLTVTATYQYTAYWGDLYEVSDTKEIIVS